MKKLWLAACTAILGAALLVAGCGNSSSGSSGDKVLKVGATAVPHAEILQQVKPILAKEGIKLDIVEFSDYVQPNQALADKDLDANFFQHKPYLDEFNKTHGTDLVIAGKVHIEPMGIYSKSIKNIKDVPNGAKVAIPNDPTNGGRALLLLQKAGLITLKPGTGTNETKADIASNPKNLQIIELDAPQLPRSLDDAALAIINTNYALQAGLNPTKDALVIEDKSSPYANVVVVRNGEQNNPEIKKLIEALNSPQIKQFIEEHYKGAIVPAF